MRRPCILVYRQAQLPNIEYVNPARLCFFESAQHARQAADNAHHGAHAAVAPSRQGDGGAANPACNSRTQDEGRTTADTAIDMTKYQRKRSKKRREIFQEAPADDRANQVPTNAGTESALTLIGPR